MPAPPVRQAALLHILKSHVIEDEGGHAVQVLCEYLPGESQGTIAQGIINLVSCGYVHLEKNARGWTTRIEITDAGRTRYEEIKHFLTPKSAEPEPEVIEVPVEVPLPGFSIEEFSDQLTGLVARAAEAERLSIETSELRSLLSMYERRAQRAEERVTLLERELEALRLRAESLRPQDMPKEWYELARKAIAQGFSITPTSGGHYKWTAPNGRFYFSSGTTSDWRTVHNTESKLVELGLRR